MTERMSAAEFAATRHRLGLTQTEMAERLGVTRASIAAWESSRDKPEPIPYRIPGLLTRLDAEHRDLVQQMVDADTPIYLRRGDGWALGAAARALEMEPDLMVEWL